MSSSIPSWQILTAHAQPFRGARDLTFCLKVPLDSLLVWASSGGSGETARMRRLAWTFAARIGDKYQMCLARSNLFGKNDENCVKYHNYCCQFYVIGHFNKIMLPKAKLLNWKKDIQKFSEGQEFPRNVEWLIYGTLPSCKFKGFSALHL